MGINIPQDGDLETRALARRIVEGLDDQVSPFEVTEARTSVVSTRVYVGVKNLLTSEEFIVQIDKV